MVLVFINGRVGTSITVNMLTEPRMEWLLNIGIIISPFSENTKKTRDMDLEFSYIKTSNDFLHTKMVKIMVYQSRKGPILIFGSIFYSKTEKWFNNLIKQQLTKSNQDLILLDFIKMAQAVKEMCTDLLKNLIILMKKWTNCKLN